MVQGALCHRESMSARGDGAGGAGEGDAIVCKCSGMNGCPSPWWPPLLEAGIQLAELNE